jgi:serine/threonine-protein kinase RsbW
LYILDPTAMSEQLVIKSSPDNVVQVESFLEGVLRTHQVDDEIYGNILITVTEAVNNAILHGNKGNADKDVIVECRVAENKKNIIFRITDQGAGFDHNNLPDPTAPENIEKLSGRGVFLMKQLADMVIFDDNGATVELNFRL